MPPKKKVDPEVLQQQFDTYKQTDEYKKWVALRDLLKKQYPEISETNNDLTGPWDKYYAELMDFMKMFKIKTEHPQIRSFFFAHEDKEEQKVMIDGIHCATEKKYADTAYKLRHNFIDIYRAIIDVEDSLNAENYQTNKKNLIKTMTELFKNLAKYIKEGGHKEVYDVQMKSVLLALENLINTNSKYKIFMEKYRSELERRIRHFKYKAIRDKYIEHFTEVMRILHGENKEPKITCRIDPKKLFNKLEYKNWENNPVEELYLSSLHQSFNEMKKQLWLLFALSKDFWKIPLHENAELVAAIQELIKSDMICENLMGNELKRDQLNFVYSVCSIIKKSNEDISRNMENKDDNSISKSIPTLIVFKTIQYMRDWKDKKQEREEKLLQNRKQLGMLMDQKKEIESKSPIKQELAARQAQNSIQKSSQKKIDFEEEKNQDQLDQEEYGRYWLLENYIPNDKKQIFEECVEMLRHINKAVQQDIEDQIVKEGMVPKLRGRGNKEKLEAMEKLDKLMKDDYDKVEKNIIRPPELWNYPKVLETHTFRSIADPKKCYIDGRIETFEEKTNFLADVLHTCKQQSWNELVSRVIDVFKKVYNKEPVGLSAAELYLK